MTKVLRSRWFMPAFSVALWAGGEEGSAWFALGLLTLVGVLVLIGGRFDMVRGLRGDGRDEYWQRIDVHATAAAGTVLIVAVIAMSLWELAQGRSGSPYIQLGAVAGIAYLAALALLRIRS